MPGFLRTLCLVAAIASLTVRADDDRTATAAHLQQVKNCQATRYSLKTMLYHEDFNIPMCADFGDPFVRDAFPKEISEPQQRALLDALVATLPEPDEKTIEGFRKLISQGPPTELVGVGDLSATPFPTSDSTMGR